MRLHRDVKMVVLDLTRFVNMTVQIDDAICETNLNVSAFSFFRARRAQSDCRE
jgi:beta-galactosidase/beta-glucuronidase